MLQNKSFRNSILLFITAFIWGTSFSAQSAGMKYIGPFTFSVIRYIIGGLTLIPVILFLRRKQDDPGDFRLSVKCGIICGIILFAASNFQQIAMMKASAGKAGFITALYIIIVPFIGIFMKKKTSLLIWLSVFLALVGLYFLCIGTKGSFEIDKYDICLFICSIIFSLHIIYIDHANEKHVDGVIMSCTQFFVAGFISILFVWPVDGLVFDKLPDISSITTAFPALLYAGIMACSIAYTLQIIGQKGVNPTVASLILSLESVFSAIGGFLILGQKMTRDEILGCVIMFISIIIAECSKKE